MKIVLGLGAVARLGQSTKICFLFKQLTSTQKNMLKVYISYDCSVRVSNELGAVHPRVTKFSVLVVNENDIIISSFCDCYDIMGCFEQVFHY
jgi:hypothetical protein